MEQLDSGEEIPCSSNFDNVALWPEDSKTVDAPMHGTYPANQNKYSEYTDLMGERFISGMVMVDNWRETTSFISGTADLNLPTMTRLLT